MSKWATKQQIEDMIRLYQSGLTAKESANSYGYEQSMLLYHLKKNGVRIRPPEEFHRKFTIDFNFFDDINTEEKAYWLGFLFADGCLSEKNKISISIGEIDELHLSKFKTSANLGHNITKHNYQYEYSKGNNPIVSITIRSNDWAKALSNLGLTSNKSLTADPNTDLIPHDLQRHFWRGIVDGDGWIYIDNNKTASHVVGLCGSLPTIEKFSKFLSLYNIPAKKPGTSGKIKTIQYQGLYTPQIVASVLYNKANIYLDRKYKLYNDLLNIKGRLKTKYYYLAESLGIFNGSISFV